MSTRKIKKNISFNVIGILGKIGIAFILSPFLINTLGDEKYGIWTIAAAFTGYMSLLDAGISSAVNRYVSKFNALNDINTVNSIISSAFVLLLMISFVIALVSPISAHLLSSLVNTSQVNNDVIFFLIIIISFDIGLFLIGNLFRGFFGGIQRYDINTILMLSTSIYKALMFYLLLTQGFGLITMGFIALSGNLLSLTLFYFFLRKIEPRFKISFSFANKENMRLIINFSKFTFIAMIANQITYFSDAFIIGYFLSASAITYYSIPQSLTTYSNKIILAISRSFTPAFSELEAKNKLTHIHDIFISGTKFTLIISNLLNIGFLFFGGTLISLWIGPKYQALCENVLIILFLNQLFVCPQLISYSLLQGISKQKVYSYFSFSISIVSLALGIYMVQDWGIEGVALSIAIPQIMFFGFFVPYYTLKTINLSIVSYLGSTYMLIMLPSIILAFSLYVFKTYFVIDNFLALIYYALVASLLYLIAIYFFSLDKNEQNTINSILKKYT